MLGINFGVHAAESNAPIRGLPFRYCKAHVPDDIEKALCNADGPAFWEATKRLLESQDADQRHLSAKILEKVWKKDESLGDGLPWPALSEPNFRAFVVEQLAPVVRDGGSSVPLSQLQQFAIQYREAAEGRQYAVVLIGVTDAPGQTPLLRELVKNNPEGQRRTALLALATRCERASEKILKDALADATLSDDDKTVAKVALEERRSTRVMRWCTRKNASTL